MFLFREKTQEQRCRVVSRVWHQFENRDVELLVNLTGVGAVIRFRKSSHPSDSTETPGSAGCLFVLVL